MNRLLFAKQAEDRAPSGCGPQARWLCCSLLTYRAGYASSLAPRQQAWGPAAECELISARTLSAISGSRRVKPIAPRFEIRLGRISTELQSLSNSASAATSGESRPGFVDAGPQAKSPRVHPTLAAGK